MWYFASGDSGFYFLEQLVQLGWTPRIWHPEYSFGVSTLVRMWFDYPYLLMVKLLYFAGLNWWMIDKLMWMIVLVVAILFILKLSRTLSFSKIQSVMSCVIYCTNTYILLLFGGGQLGVALSYALSPYVLYRFIKFIDQITTNKEVFSIKYKVLSIKYLVSLLRQGFGGQASIKYGIQNGLWLALLVCFDLRIAYLVLGAVMLYGLFRCIVEKRFTILISALCSLLFALCIAGMIHLFWILPLIMVRGGFELGQDLTNTGMLKFLSVADFSHALSLLHPNWPENLFGKVYFLQPEFLVLPLLAFSALLFLNKTNRTNRTKILFFAFLALGGAFLAKGANEPFGGVFVWLFEHMPGFVMFRDPTKFYLFTALGYSVLIPFTIRTIAERESIWYLVSLLRQGYGGQASRKKQKHFILNTRYLILYTIFLCFWLFSIRAVFTGQVKGNFRPLQLSHEYVQLKDMWVNDKEPYRTLWLPRTDKFVYSSDIHPVLTGDTLWKNASIGALLTIIKSPDFSKTVEAGGVRYIIVPQDLEKRIFLSDYRFDPSIRGELIQAISNAHYQRKEGYGGLAIFENPTYSFTASIPEYVKKQEYFSRIGLIISGCTIILLTGWLCLNSRKSIKS